MSRGKYRYSVLSREDFERGWRVQFERLFKVDAGTGLPVWFPHQVFRIHGKFMFYIPSPIFMRYHYVPFEEVLSRYGEEEFVVVGLEYLETDSEKVGLVFQLDSEMSEEDLRYYIDWQPFEFLMFGRRDDWAFVNSEGYNIMVLCASGELWEEFSRVYPGVSRSRLEEYLNHCPDDYRRLFEMNYLEG